MVGPSAPMHTDLPATATRKGSPEPSGQRPTHFGTTVRDRLTVGAAAATLGAIVVLVVFSASGEREAPLVALLYGAIPWALAGFITGRRSAAIKMATAGTVVGLTLVSIVWVWINGPDEALLGGTAWRPPRPRWTP